MHPFLGVARLSIYDVSGKRVWSEELSTINSFTWDRRTTSGSPASPGTYFLTLETPGYTGRTKIILM
jgi:hypothetical protein